MLNSPQWQNSMHIQEAVPPSCRIKQKVLHFDARHMRCSLFAAVHIMISCSRFVSRMSSQHCTAAKDVQAYSSRHSWHLICNQSKGCDTWVPWVASALCRLQCGTISRNETLGPHMDVAYHASRLRAVRDHHTVVLQATDVDKYGRCRSCAQSRVGMSEACLSCSCMSVPDMTMCRHMPRVLAQSLRRSRSAILSMTAP